MESNPIIASMLLAAAITTLIINTLLPFAPRLGLIDQPAPRKVHQQPRPRIGGWGIVAGTLGALLPWVAIDDPLLQGLLFASGVLFLFGVWDDRCAIGHYWKFTGQLLALLPLLLHGGLRVTQLPLVATPLPEMIALPFTLLALIGVINALNHADGLDGLAGGEALLTLLAAAVLAARGGADGVLLLALAGAAGVIAFLRYNLHPARLFMGDSGSQFLGLLVGVVAILLTQGETSPLPPAAVLLLIGLPLADILVVLYRRIRSRRNWFLATDNHFHHRLLRLGLSHRHSVQLLWLLHSLLVGAALLHAHLPTPLLLLLHPLLCALWLLLLGWLERRAPRLERETATPGH